jgi:dolichyl-phosphate-mannose--protein O-mannosyl transferase
MQYLPWVLVPRGTYIYHYFPCVPFLILSIVLCLDAVADGPAGSAAAEGAAQAAVKGNEKLALWLLIALLAIALGLFIFFFPYASGIEASEKWMDDAKWFKNWLWY